MDERSPDSQVDLSPVNPALPIFGDAFDSPDRSYARTESTTTAPSVLQTSEFMVGTVAVGLILIESACAATPTNNCEDWSATEKADVLAEIRESLDWWQAQALASGVPLRFVLDVGDTGNAKVVTSDVEPITMNKSQDAVWINEAMDAFEVPDAESAYARVRLYDDFLRNAHETNWAFTVFVVDSSRDDDDLFSDYWPPYATYGGPLLTLTYGVAGWGIDIMSGVAAHEIAHIFYALDQYPGAELGCESTKGYLGAQNQNSMYHPGLSQCALNQDSLMRHPEHTALDHFVRGQIGWWDTDSDRIVDPVDTEVAISQFDCESVDDSLHLSMLASDLPLDSPELPSVTINAIEAIDVQVNGGAWKAATTETELNTFEEHFSFATAAQSLQSINIRLRTTHCSETTWSFDSIGGVCPDLSSATKTTGRAPNCGVQQTFIPLVGN